MELDKIITEVYDTANKSYPAYSSPARKDFTPQSARNTPNFPYQHQDDLNNPPPESVPSLPWPLSTVVDDLTDSFIFLSQAMDKISSAVKNNPSLNDKQKTKLIRLYKIAKFALKGIRKVGLHIIDVANIAGPQPSQNPVPNPQYQPPESQPLKNRIKIRVR
jgi:hypothetical protein